MQLLVVKIEGTKDKLCAVVQSQGPAYLEQGQAVVTLSREAGAELKTAIEALLKNRMPKAPVLSTAPSEPEDADARLALANKRIRELERKLARVREIVG
jgi:hypothetical protein